jgi:aquaporin Z
MTGMLKLIYSFCIMRVMPIRIYAGTGMKQLVASWRKNYVHYLQEALGLGLFMVSACFFGAMIFSPGSAWYAIFPSMMYRNICMGLAMGGTALFLFYSPFTAPSGSQLNPAVTLTFLSLNKMCRYDAMFYMLFQLAGGTITVLFMQWKMGDILIQAPVSSVVTIPGKAGTGWAFVTELMIAFITMSMVLFTSNNSIWKKYTRICSAILVCSWVILAGPVSGFSMNPARSFASAFSSGIWTSFWIYLIAPFAGMLLAGWVFHQRIMKEQPVNGLADQTPTARKKIPEPLEFML